MFSAQSGQIINDYTRGQILRDISKFLVTILIILGGNNFDGDVFDGNIHNQIVDEILCHFQTIFQKAEESGTKIFVCGLIPRPKYPHLKKYFEKTSHGGLKIEKYCNKYCPLVVTSIHKRINSNIFPEF